MNELEKIEDKLHEAGFKGQGMTIAVIDADLIKAGASPSP